MDELQKRLLEQNADMIKHYQHGADERHEAEKRKHKGLLTLLKGDVKYVRIRLLHRYSFRYWLASCCNCSYIHGYYKLVQLEVKYEEIHNL